MVPLRRLAWMYRELANHAARSEYAAGDLLIGVTDDGEVVGLNEPHEVEEQIAQLCEARLGSSIQLSPSVSDGVLILQIHQAVDGFFDIEGRVPTRTGATVTWIDEPKSGQDVFFLRIRYFMSFATSSTSPMVEHSLTLRP